MPSVDIDMLVKRIVEKKNAEERLGDKTNDTPSSAEDFSSMFNSIKAIVSQSVSEINTKLANEDIKFQIVTGVDNENSNRKAVQIVLNNEHKQINLLEDPYLLIEGYANEGKIRVVPGRSTERGDLVEAVNVDSNYINSAISDFVKTL